MAMFPKRKNWLQDTLWKPKRPMSVEHLRHLYNVLLKNITVTDRNRGLIIESLRSMTEIIIWGDQHDGRIFDFFAEKNMLSLFIRFLEQRSHFVRVQFLQTINILLENLRNRNSMFYLLSNNHINNIIVYNFDFSDDETMAYYISILKSLSLKLDEDTIHFFYNEHQQNFPLFTEAIKFYDHSESMVRTAVRTLTLNVLRVADPPMLRFIRDGTALPYFSNVAWSIGNLALEIDKIRRESVLSHCAKLKDLVAEHVDHLHYINDIYCLNINCINGILTDQLLNRLLIPLYLYSLILNTSNDQHSADNTSQGATPVIDSTIAMFLLSQVFYIITYRPLISCLCDIILYGDESLSMVGKSNSLESDESSSSSSLMKRRSVSLLKSHRVFGPPEQSLCDALNSLKTKRTRADSDSTIDGDQFLFPESSSDEVSLSSDSESNDLDERTATEKRKKVKESLENPLKDSEPNSLSTKIQTKNDANASLEKEISTPAAVLNTLDPLIEDTYVKGDASLKDVLSTNTAEKDGGSDLQLPEVTDDSPELQISTKDSKRSFWNLVLKSLDYEDEDIAGLFALLLVNGILETKGISPGLLKNLLPLETSNKEDTPHHYELVEKLLTIIEGACCRNVPTRLSTLEILCRVMMYLSISPHSNVRLLSEEHARLLHRARELAAGQLKVLYTVEDVFLDMFEDEYRSLKNNKPIKADNLVMDGSLLLSYSGTPITAIEFSKRLPCNAIEKARRAMRIFLMIRKLTNEFDGISGTDLSLFDTVGSISVKDVLDLNNIDLMACHVITSEKMVRRFLAVRETQFILVDTDTTKIGWGVVRFVGNLQDVEVSSDRDDNKGLQISIRQTSTATAISRGTLSMLTAKFVFTDHINCIVAKQCLKRGRVIVRQRKLFQLGKALGFSFSSATNQAANADTSILTLAKTEGKLISAGKSTGTTDLSLVINEAPKPQFMLRSVQPAVTKNSNGSELNKVEAIALNTAQSVASYKNTSANNNLSPVQLLPPSSALGIGSDSDLAATESNDAFSNLNEALEKLGLDTNDAVRLLPPASSSSANTGQSGSSTKDHGIGVKK